jgi:pilus assembly protein CpaF
VQTQIPDWLLELIDNQSVTDILLSQDGCLIDFGAGLTSQREHLLSEPELQQLARELIELGGRRLDHANPFADVALPGGLRVHAVLKSGCSEQTQISIRLHNSKTKNLEQLLLEPFVTRAQHNQIQQIVESGDSFLIAGATGSGKTTLLKAMLAATNQRVIAVEDVTELKHENIICLQTRTKNIEGQGEISLDQLVRESLRMRPDRLVVGEVRGAELISMLQALNTGHRGATTIHANSLSQVPQRLATINATFGVSEKAFRQMVLSAFDWVIALASYNGVRKVSGIGKFTICENQLEVLQQPPEKKLALA